MFPADNAWNQDVSALPVATNSANYLTAIASLGGNQKLHADFGGGGEYGIPYITVPGTQPKVPVDFTDYGDESDPGPYPIPLAAPDRGRRRGRPRTCSPSTATTASSTSCSASSSGASRWSAASGAVFDLTSNALRPDGWTSADAAGLPIFPGLVRYDEVASGHIDHALRFTVSQYAARRTCTRRRTGRRRSTDPNLPPMGLRLRLKASFDVSGYTGEARVVLDALKKYGMIVADNGSNWFISGAADPRWNDDDLNQLKTVPGQRVRGRRTPARRCTQ